MHRLTINIPETAVKGLRGKSVMLFQSTSEDWAVACVVYNVIDSLPTVVEAGSIYAYATPIRPPFRSCQILSAIDPSDQPLRANKLVVFDGARFIDGGELPNEFSFGIRNGRPDAAGTLSCGLAQDIAVNGHHATTPVNLQALGTGSTVYFPVNDTFWLGLVELAGIPPRAGVLLRSSMVAAAKPVELACIPTLSRFSKVSFSAASEWTADYSEASNTFNLRQA